MVSESYERVRDRACDRLWEVDALREGRLAVADAESFERHRRACAECRNRLAHDDRLRALARSLPAPSVDEIAAKRLRARILRDAAGAPRSRAISWVAALAAALAAVAAIVGFVALRSQRRAVPGESASLSASSASSASSATFAARVTAAPRAIFSQRRDGAIETVTLDDGAISVTVRPQASSERFVVALPDGEIEVRGTTFTVVAFAGRTTRVRVDEGVVALRIDGEIEMLLHAREEWPTPVPAVAASSAPPVAPSPKVASSAALRPTAAVASTAATSASDEYLEAMRLFRAHDYDAAAQAFHAFAAAHPRAPESEDAAFLEASALAYAGRADAAAVIAERFLEKFASSFHARDAAILVARAARDRGDCEKAKRVAGRWTSRETTPEWTAALGACASR